MNSKHQDLTFRAARIVCVAGCLLAADRLETPVALAQAAPPLTSAPAPAAVVAPPPGPLGGPGMPGQTLQSAKAVGAGALTWDQVKAKFEAANPVLKEDQLLNVDEMKAEGITAYLRPNPQFTMTADGTAIAPHDGTWQPTKGTFLSPNFRDRKSTRLNSSHL